MIEVAEVLRGVTLKQIETFYWVTALGSFSAAATRLHTTQPAISNRIREFEEAVGALLLDPTVRKPRVTPKGRELLAICEQFLHLEQALERAADAAHTVSGLVRVGAADTVALTWLPTLVSRLSEQYPQLDVELFVDLSLNLQSRLADRDLDIAFLVGPIGDPGIESRPLGDVRNAWMCAPACLPRQSQGSITPVQMAGIPIFTHSRGSHLHRMVMDWFDGHGVRPARVHGCNSLATMIRMTIDGLGLAVLPIEMMRQEIQRKELAVVAPHLSFPPNRFVVAYPKRSFESTSKVIADLAVELATSGGIFQPLPRTRDVPAVRRPA